MTTDPLRRFARSRLFIPALVALLASPAHAGLVVQVESVDASAGSTGSTFDVTLTNTGPGVVTIDAFSFGLLVDPAITLTTATTDAPSYIFAAGSAFGPDITLPGGPPLLASDLCDGPGGAVDIDSGQTVGLGRIHFNVSASASGDYSVTLLGSPETSLAFAGAEVPIDTLANGAIHVTPSPVPEPSGMMLAGSGLVALLVARARRDGPARRGPDGRR